jgi:hypothetical protein
MGGGKTAAPIEADGSDGAFLYISANAGLFI